MTLDHYRGDPLAQTREWTVLGDDELKRRAVKAAGERDTATLLSLTLAYLQHAGGSGMLTSPHTLKAYRTGVRQFLEWSDVNAVSLLRPGRHDGQHYINHLIAAGRAPAGVQLKVAAAGSLYRALRWAGATQANPFEDTTIVKDRTPGIIKRPPYTDDEILDVLDVADVQASFLLLVTAHGGLRISEALNLKWADLNIEARQLHVTSGKGRKARVVAMSTSLVRAAREYRSLYGPGGELAQDGYRTSAPENVFRFKDRETAVYHMKKAFQQAGVKFRGFHPGRKYAGTRLLQQVKDFGRVAAHLGHESIDTTRKGYAALPVDDLKEDLRGW